MKSRMRTSCGAAILLLIAAPSLVVAQIETNLEHYTGPNARGYLAPLEDAFGAALHTGMYRSAAIPRSRLRVDLGIKIGIVRFGDSDRTFTASAESGFSGPTSTATAPTVVGDENAVVLEGYGGTEFIFPGGLDLGSLALPVPQITVSGVAGTQVLFRWVAFDTGDETVGRVELLGLGLRHSISQYIPASPLDVAAGLTWQTFRAGDKLVDASGLSFGAQASRRFSSLEPYVGAAVDRFEMSVDYNYGSGTESIPLHVEFGSKTKLHLSCGLGANLGPLHLYGEIGTVGRGVFSIGFELGN